MIRNCIWITVGSLCGWLNAAPLALDYIYPAGCRRGSSCEVEVGGNWSGTSLTSGVAGEGVRAVYSAPVYRYVQEKINTGSKSKSAQKIRYTKSVLPGHAILRMNVGPQVEAGVREVYVDCQYEISNPVKFEISDYEEIVEPATNRVSGSLIELQNLPVCLNGRIWGEKPDSYRFRAESGAKIVAYCRAEVLPPGSFVPALQIADASGAVVTNGVVLYQERQAPVLVFTVGTAGDYTLNVSDASGKGGRSSVYRILLGELALITDFSPRCVTRGSSENITLSGVNLDRTRVRLFSGGKDSAMCRQALAGDALVLPGLRFDLVDEAVISEAEPNDSADQAQPLTLPVVVQGICEPGGSVLDFYSFDAAADQELYIDVESGAGEPAVTVRDGRGAVVASGVYRELSAAERLIQGSGVSLPFKPSAAGRHTIELSFRQRGGATPLYYQMRVGAPVPDYAIWMSPVAINIPSYGSQLVELYLRRIHGFNAPVAVTAAFPPLGVISSGGLIGPDAQRGVITLWTDGRRYPRTPFYQELMAVADLNGVAQKKTVIPFAKVGEQSGAGGVVTFEKSPARVNYYASGMLINTEGVPPLVLSGDKTSEIMLTVRSVAGHVADDYDYIVLAPEKGVNIKNKIASNAKDVLRLNLSLSPDTPFKAGESGDLIIGMVKKGADRNRLGAVSQAVRFTCR